MILDRIVALPAARSRRRTVFPDAHSSRPARPRAAASCWACTCRAPGSTPKRREGDQFAPNAFIRIDGDGQITLVMPYVEMGQGTYTSIPMLIAEELEVDLKQVQLEHAPPNNKLYMNPLLGEQATGNSNAVRGAWKPLREAGATATHDAGRGGGQALERRSGVLPRAERRGASSADRAGARPMASLPPMPPECRSRRTWRSSSRRISS